MFPKKNPQPRPVPRPLMSRWSETSCRFATPQCSRRVSPPPQAWVVVIWLAFGPIYQGTSVVPVGPGETPNEPTRTSASLIEVNGWQVLPILLAPDALTGLALLTVLFTHTGQARRKTLLWLLTALLLVFYILGSFTIGIFYLPSALVLLLTAIGVSTSRRTTNQRLANRR